MAADHRIALVPFAGAERRRVDVEQDVRALRHQLGQRLDVVVGVPHVFADRDPEADAAGAGGDVDRPALAPGREEALVIEIAVVRQQRLVGPLQHPPVADDGSGVVLADRAVLVAGAGGDVDEADDGGDAGGGSSNPLHCRLVGLEEAGVLDEVADAIAGQRHLGRDQQLGAGRDRAREGVEDRRRVAGDVAAGGIELSERDAHVGITILSVRRRPRL